MNNVVDHLLKTSICPRTRSQYECGYSAYVTFLSMSGIQWHNCGMPPVSEDSLIYFATHCFKELQLKCSTIKMYICGVRYKYLESGERTLFNNANDKLYRLDALYRGIKKNERASPKPRLPITFSLLKNMCMLLRNRFYTSFVDALLEATCVTAYFGFLRCGEFTVTNAFDPESNVCMEDLIFYHDRVTLHLKASKTDPFREGVDIHLFKTNADICPVISLERYLTLRNSIFKCSNQKDPFFIMDNGKALTRFYFINTLKKIILRLGYNPDVYNGHSFRKGAATQASAKIEDHLIQALGRWTSQCYTRYISTSLDSLKQAQRSLLE